MIYRAWCVGGATAVEQGPPSEPEDYLAALRLGLQKRAATNVEAVDLAAHSRSESNRFTGSGDVTSSDLLWPVILVRLTLNPQIVIFWEKETKKILAQLSALLSWRVYKIMGSAEVGTSPWSWLCCAAGCADGWPKLSVY